MLGYFQYQSFSRKSFNMWLRVFKEFCFINARYKINIKFLYLHVNTNATKINI